VLTDFGLARADAFDSRLTRTQAVIGTPLYMAPEQVGGRTRDIGPRTDVYALGVILYEMLAGRPPFTAPTPAELYQQILAGDPAHPSRHGRSVDHELELVALKALSKERELRYASATEFADDLARWLRGERVTARPAGIAYRLRRALARRAGIVAGLVVALLVAAAAVPWGLAQGRKRDEEARLREAQERELAATRELGTLWSDVLVARQAFLNPSTDPARVRSGLLAIVDRVSAYIDRYPSRPQGWYVRARARLLIGDLSEAEGDLRRALEIDAGFSPGEALLARILLERHALQNFGDPFHADETARKSEHLLLEARRHLDRSLRDAATDRWGLPRTPDDEATEVLCRAMVTAYVEKDVARASTMLAEADARYPSEEYAHWRGIWSTDPRERMELLSLSITRMPHHARVRVDRGFERIGRGDHDGALEDLRAALAINPRIRGANENLAHALFAMGDPDAAIEVCDRILATQPSNVSLRILRGLARMKKGDADGAREDFDHAVATSPDTAQAWSNRGMVRASQGDEEGALADYAKAIELSPRLMGARENRGTLRLKRGAFADAIADFDVAIEMNPRSANALYRRAAARASLWQASRVNDRSELRKVRDDLDRAFAAAPEKWMARVAAEELDSWLRMMERDE
jgi:tetratricopeptide (TPR) repeat protein